ncbi:MAG: M23 family metallopeptidase [Bacteroidia bacterium]
MGYKRGILGILFIIVACASVAQPVVFRFPLDTIPLLSGTFGEFRGTHFHAGIDIKTYGQTGLPVYATADGYVSRIKISPYGYGKAIYLTHDNGYTSVYGHLSGFNPELEAYIRKHQYAKKSYNIELFPGKTHFKVKQGELIAYSGNTGGSYAPHLHFELRDTKTQEIIDPLSFSLPVTDTLPPHLSVIKVVSKNRNDRWLTGQYPEAARVYTTSDSVYWLKIQKGEYALILAARDFLTSDTSNVLGVQSVLIELDGQHLYTRKTSRFSFRDSRYIHLISSFENNLPPLEHCFKESWIHHDLAEYTNDGWFTIDYNQKRSIKITLSDAYGHARVVTLNLELDNIGKGHVSSFGRSDCKETLLYDKAFSFSLDEGKHLIDFFPNSFFDTLNIHVCVNPGIVDTLIIYPMNGYVSERFRLVYSLPDSFPALPRQVCLARAGSDGPEYVGGEINSGKIQCYTRNMGTYFLSMDTLAPTVEFQAINGDTLFLQMGDDFSGIAKYTPRIEGRWFLMEYDPKTGLLFGDLSNFPKGDKLELDLLVKDNRGNTTAYKKTIER